MEGAGRKGPPLPSGAASTKPESLPSPRTLHVFSGVRRPSRRILTRSARCLFLGLITTFVVAAAVGWYRPYLGKPAEYDSRIAIRTEWGPAERTEVFGTSEYGVFVWTPLGPYRPATAHEIRQLFRAAKWTPANLQPWRHNYSFGPDGSARMFEWGWPFRCVWGACTGSWDSPWGDQFGLYRRQSANTRNVRAMPFAPIPTGIALNCVFWAAAWWVALLGSASLRSAIRQRRNLCPRCAYSLLNLPPNSPCPECGHAP